MREFNSIQEKILDRTLFVIGKKGSYHVSVRDITQAAGVNVNAINYYFGTKENLLDQMEEFFIENFISAYSVLDADINDEEKLVLWANEIMEYTLQYPGIQIILRDNMRSEGGGKMKEFLIGQSYVLNQKVDELLMRLIGIGGEKLKLFRILFDSAILYPASFGTEQNYDTTQIKEKEFRMGYIRFVIELLKKGINPL